MSLQQRQHIATEGVVVAAVDVIRDPAVISLVATLSKQQQSKDGETAEKGATASALQEASRRKLKAKIRITTRAMWTDGGKLLELLHTSAEAAIAKLPGDAALSAVERVVGDSLRRASKQFNNRRPEVIIIAHEADPRMGAAAGAMAKRRSSREVRNGDRDDTRGKRPNVQPGKPKRPGNGGATGSAGPPRGRGRPPKGPPPLERLSPEMIEQRRKQNPRDKPDSGGDVEYP
jgi:hypothetical protein